MHLIVCKKNIEKIVFSGNNVFEFLTKEDMRGFKAIRNIATHDYDGLNFAIIEATIKEYLPPIKERIDLFLQQQIN
ncbi:hypothetical protein CQA49_06760 [Helicobacter sp. MIT 00-7814]|nr:hypothetical protein CQA49_06760 [Helicobacter sp. MIT 00-7814]RDU54196.1 hypothetical protein CQA37_06000 [Helicobacter sp. MIT 99-10781]